MEPHSPLDMSNTSLNLSKKIPMSLNKSFTPADSSRMPIIQFENKIHKDLPLLEIISPSLDRSRLDPAYLIDGKRQIRKSRIHSSMDSKNCESNEKSEHGKIDNKKISGNFNVMFRIVKHFRKWVFFHSYKNLKDYHIRIVNDQTTYFEEEDDSSDENRDKQFKSIWSTQKGKMKRRKKTKSIIPSALTFLGKKIKILANSGGYFSKFVHCFKKLNVFDQNHIFKVIWDFIIILLVIILLFAYSIERSFNVDLLKSDSSHDFFLTMIIIISLDSLVSLNTNIYYAGVQVKSRGLIIINYFKKHFLLDMAGCIGTVLYYNSADRGYNDFTLLLLFKLLTKQDMHKKIKHIVVRSDRFEAVFDLLMLGLKILISGHIIACLWHYISYRESIFDPHKNSWLKDKGLLLENWRVKYLYSIYWSVTTMLTVGYGDVTPKNEDEILFNIWAMFFGCVIFGYSMNSIGEILKRSGKYTRLLKEKTDRLNLMLRGMSLTTDLEHKVRKYLEFVWHQEEMDNPDAHSVFLNQLSASLRDEIFLQTNVKYLRFVSVFNRIFSNDTLLKLAKSMKKVRFSPEEFVYKSGQSEDFNLYIITEGTAISVTEKDTNKYYPLTSWDKLKKNDYFGIHEFFTEHDRRDSVFTKEFTTVFQINRGDLLAIIKKNPAEYERFCKIKDSLILYGNPISLDLKCSSCGRVDHRVFDCKFLKYTPDPSKVAYKHTLHEKKLRKRFKRSKASKSNALKISEEVFNSAKDFLLDFEDDQLVKELLARYENEVESPESLEMPSIQKLVPLSNESSPIKKECTNSGRDDNGFTSAVNFTEKGRAPTVHKRRESRMKSIFEKFKIPHTDDEANKYNIQVLKTKILPISDRQDSGKTKPTPKNGEIVEELFFDPDSNSILQERIKNFEFYFPQNNSIKVIDKINRKQHLLQKRKENAQVILTANQSPRKSKRVWLESRMKTKKL